MEHSIVRFKLVLFMLLAMLLFSGCANTGQHDDTFQHGDTFRYDGTTYFSANSALLRQQEDIQSAMVSIQPIEAPVFGDLAIVIPGRTTLESLGIKHTGHVPSSRAVINYVVSVMEEGNKGVIQAIHKSNLFRKVETLSEGTIARDASKKGYQYLLRIHFRAPLDEVWELTDLQTFDSRSVFPRIDGLWTFQKTCHAVIENITKAAHELRTRRPRQEKPGLPEIPGNSWDSI